MSNIGILGGTFDPIHKGHIALAEYALASCGMSRIIFLPANVSPFKLGRKMAEESHRVNMIKLVTDANPCFDVDTMEVDSNNVSYTYNTLIAMKAKYPEDRLYFILGTDSFLALEKWYNGIPLLQTFSFIVGARPGYRDDEIDLMKYHYEAKYGSEIIKMTNDMLDISSTEIKKCVKSNESIAKMVPAIVERYINEHGLYK